MKANIFSSYNGFKYYGYFIKNFIRNNLRRTFTTISKPKPNRAILAKAIHINLHV